MRNAGRKNNRGETLGLRAVMTAEAVILSGGLDSLGPLVSYRLPAARQANKDGDLDIELLVGEFQGNLQIVKVLLGTKLKRALAICKGQSRIEIGGPSSGSLQVSQGKRVLYQYFHYRRG